MGQGRAEQGRRRAHGRNARHHGKFDPVAEMQALEHLQGQSGHVRSRVPVENEEGDVGACAVTGLTVKSAVLFNANTGEVLYEQNPDFQIPPASLTKVLTLYLIFDAIREGRLRPWDVVDVSERASTQGGSNMGTIICGSSSLGVASTDSTPVRTAAMIRSGASLESTNRAVTRASQSDWWPWRRAGQWAGTRARRRR